MSDSRKSIWGLTLLTGLIALGWKLFALPYDDDFSYMRTVIPGDEDVFWEGAGSVITSWGDAFSTLWPHYTTINGRLANLLMFLTVPMPQWIVALLQALVAALSVWAVLRIASSTAVGVHTGRVSLHSHTELKPWVAALIAFAFWFWFPWNDNMVSTDYFLNYPLPAATLLAYGLLLTDTRTDRTPLLAALGFFTGWLHEAFGLAAIIGSVLWIIFSKTNRRRSIVVTLALISGTAINTFAPSTLARIDRFVIDDTIHHTFHYLLESKPPYIALLLTVIAAGCRCITPHVLKTLGFWAAIAVTSFAIGWHFRGTGHFFWPMFTALYAYSAILLALIFAKSKPLFPLAILITLCYAAWGIGLTVQSARAAKVQRAVLNQLEAGREIIYVPTHSPQPKWALGMTPTYDGDPRQANYLGLRYIEGGWDSIPHLIPATDAGIPAKDFNE